MDRSSPSKVWKEMGDKERKINIKDIWKSHMEAW